MRHYPLIDVAMVLPIVYIDCMRKYKSPNPMMQMQYQVMIDMARDKSSTLYNKDGSQRTGASHRSVFWRGYNGTYDNHPNLKPCPGTCVYPCFRAGEDYRAECAGTTDMAEP